MGRIEGKKLVKHAPLRPYVHTEMDTTVYIKSSTPYMSAVKRIEKMLSKFDEIPNKRGNLVRRGNVAKKCNCVTIKGMGKAIGRVLSIGMHFKYDEKFEVDFFTKTIGVLDEFTKEQNEDEKADDDEDEDDEEDDLLRKRNVGAIEVRIYVS